MCRSEHQMLVAVDECPFLLSICPPKDKYKVLTLLGKAAYDRIGKRLPPFSLVRTSLMRLYRERSIEQQHALSCPSGKVAIGGKGLTQVALNFFKDIL